MRARRAGDPHERLRRRSTASTATSSTPRAAWACASARCSRSVELPLALPLLFAGIRTAAVYVVATVPLGALDGHRRRPRRHHRQPGQLPARGRRRRRDLRRRAGALHRRRSSRRCSASPPRAGCAARSTSLPSRRRRQATHKRKGHRDHPQMDQRSRRTTGRGACHRRRRVRQQQRQQELVVEHGSSSSAEHPASPGKGKPAVTIGDKNFTEQYILGELYAQALRAKGFTVKIKSNIGSSEIIDKALTSGQARPVPRVHRRDPVASSRKPKHAPGRPGRRLRSGQEVRGGPRLHACSSTTPFFDSDALAVKPDFATKNGLDVGRRPQEARQQADARRAAGVQDARSRACIGLEEGLRRQPDVQAARDRPAVQGARRPARSTSPTSSRPTAQLQGGKYTVLKDPKFIFGFQNVAPIVSQEGPRRSRARTSPTRSTRSARS